MRYMVVAILAAGIGLASGWFVWGRRVEAVVAKPFHLETDGPVVVDLAAGQERPSVWTGTPTFVFSSEEERDRFLAALPNDGKTRVFNEIIRPPQPVTLYAQWHHRTTEEIKRMERFRDVGSALLPWGQP